MTVALIFKVSSLATGIRVSELCLMPFNCLIQSATGKWFLKLYQFKYKRDHTIPIEPELVNVIQEQQQYIRANLEDDYPYLFCANGHLTAGRGNRIIDGYYLPVAKPPSRKQFNEILQRLGIKNNICDSSGKLWHFQSHQFRHTRRFHKVCASPLR